MIVIIDYGLGNLFSVLKAFQLLGVDAKISSEINDIEQADRLVLPGIGAFGDGISYLRQKGLDETIRQEVLEKKKPFLGVCLGLQLLAETGLEFGNHKGLGLIRGTVRKLEIEEKNLPLPHIGWNDVTIIRDTPLFKGIKPGADFYFVHSFHLECADSQDLVGTAQYGEAITAVVQKDNIFATQFHPEKSQQNGLKLLENFLTWNPNA